MSPAERLDADSIRTACAHQLVGREIVFRDEVSSTNDVVGQLAADHAEGLAVFAEHQTAGRGQYGRRWESALYRGLWLSVLLRPGIPIGESSALTELLARAVAATIQQQTGLAPAIKPPNDIYLGKRKVAGVLVEMRVEAGGSYCAVAGMGINVNHALLDFPPELQSTATSLAIAAGRQFDRSAMAIALLRVLNAEYQTFRMPQ